MLPEATLATLISALRAAGRAFEIVPDLCERVAKRDPRLTRLAGSGRFGIAACQPRAVRALLRMAGVSSEGDAGTFVNLASESAEKAIAALSEVPVLGEPGPTGGETGFRESGATPQVETRAGWYPWFPVVDFDRCTHCLECLNFCLFGVFGVDREKRLAVIAPESCKPNCPACARVCPEEAIVFPKHKSAPINGGEGGSAAEAGAVRKADLSALLGGDVYAGLRARNGAARRRFSTGPEQEQAMTERWAQIEALVASGEIPAEVIEQYRERARAR
jgi:Pyruvate/2-oxoacid:ferredoxin oxidoreductase delta subunit